MVSVQRRATTYTCQKQSFVVDLMLGGLTRISIAPQVSSLPYPYTSQTQFERSIRNPVGPQWNTATAVKELTRPKVSTLPGVIIDPIKPTKEVKRRRADQEETLNKKGRYGKKSRKDKSQSTITIHK